MDIDRIITTVDTHTAGGPTRNITGGLPPLEGANVAEKMEYFRAEHDGLRKLLMCEPRGHRDMYGAVITEPAHPGADVGAFFFTASGYLPACVHSSIGLVTAGLETGSISPGADGTVKLEVPAGLLSVRPEYDGERLEGIALRTPPAFVHTPSAVLELEGEPPIEASLVFSGVFFALVEVGQLPIAQTHGSGLLVPEHAGDLAQLGVRILEEANRSHQISHPDNAAADSIALVMLCDDRDELHGRDIVIGRTGGIDRSPCGAGTGAKVADLFVQGRLEAGQDYTLESFLDTRFVGRVLESATVGPFPGAMPEIRGSAHVIGMHQFMLTADDPLREGFAF